jgi:hypothetical protein
MSVRAPSHQLLRADRTNAEGAATAATDPKRTWEDQEIDGRVLFFSPESAGPQDQFRHRISGESARALANVNATEEVTAAWLTFAIPTS